MTTTISTTLQTAITSMYEKEAATQEKFFGRPTTIADAQVKLAKSKDVTDDNIGSPSTTKAKGSGVCGFIESTYDKKRAQEFRRLYKAQGQWAKITQLRDDHAADIPASKRDKFRMRLASKAATEVITDDHATKVLSDWNATSEKTTSKVTKKTLEGIIKRVQYTIDNPAAKPVPRLHELLALVTEIHAECGKVEAEPAPAATLEQVTPNVTPIAPAQGNTPVDPNALAQALQLLGFVQAK